MSGYWSLCRVAVGKCLVFHTRQYVSWCTVDQEFKNLRTSIRNVLQPYAEMEPDLMCWDQHILLSRHISNIAKDTIGRLETGNMTVTCISMTWAQFLDDVAAWSSWHEKLPLSCPKIGVLFLKTSCLILVIINTLGSILVPVLSQWWCITLQFDVRFCFRNLPNVSSLGDYAFL